MTGPLPREAYQDALEGWLTHSLRAELAGFRAKALSSSRVDPQLISRAVLRAAALFACEDLTQSEASDVLRSLAAELKG